MRKILLTGIILATTCAASAQKLKIHTGNTTIAVPAAEAGTMDFIAGNALSVMGHTYDLSTVDSITVDNSIVAPQSVGITYGTSGAHLLVSADVYPLLTIAVDKADVSIVAAPSLDKEVSYTLGGTSSDGSFTLTGNYKSTLTLNNLVLTNQRGAAIDIQNGKRINVILPNGTSSTLVDGVAGTQKACLFVKGHPEFSGGGSLTLTGNTKHAFASNEYTLFKSDFGSFHVAGAKSDAMHIGQYFKMKGGKFTAANVMGDGIDVEATKDATDEHNGQAFIEGGSITLNVAADDVKGIKCDSMMTISGGSIDLTVSGLGTKGISAGTDLLVQTGTAAAPSIKMAVTGTTYMPGDATLESKCRGIKVKGNFTFNGGSINISATGKKSKAISVDGIYTYKSGSINCKVDASNT